MALVDACIFSAASGGTSDFQVAAAVQGYMTPAEANAVDGDPYNYRAQSSDLTQWEIGGGLYDAGTTTLERVTVLFNSDGTGTLQSGLGSKIAFTDAPQVMLTALATDFGGGGGASGWEQTTGSPGETTTAPIDAPVGSGQAGPDIYMFAGNGDGAGDAGNIVLQIASGIQTYDVYGIPATGVVVLDATNAAGKNFQFVQPYDHVGSSQNIAFTAASSDFQGGVITISGGNSGAHYIGGNVTVGGGNGNIAGGGSATIAGGNDVGSGTGGIVNIQGGFGIPAGAGGSVNIVAGSGFGGGGGAINIGSGSGLNGDDAGDFVAGCGDGQRGGNVTFDAGQGYVNDGGTITFQSGNALGGTGNGGDITFKTGTTVGGRAGLFFPNLPTSDPGVSGAAWNNGGIVTISP